MVPMTPRLLAPAEWAEKLAGTELELAVPHLPKDTQVLVIEHAEDGLVIGTWALMHYAHVEGVWVHPDHRNKVAVARMLLAGMRELVREAQASVVLTAAVTPEVERLIRRLGGTQLPGTHFVIPVVRA